MTHRECRLESLRELCEAQGEGPEDMKKNAEDGGDTSVLAENSLSCFVLAQKFALALTFALARTFVLIRNSTNGREQCGKVRERCKSSAGAVQEQCGSGSRPHNSRRHGCQNAMQLLQSGLQSVAASPLVLLYQKQVDRKPGQDVRAAPRPAVDIAANISSRGKGRGLRDECGCRS